MKQCVKGYNGAMCGRFALYETEDLGPRFMLADQPRFVSRLEQEAGAFHETAAGDLHGQVLDTDHRSSFTSSSTLDP